MPTVIASNTAPRVVKVTAASIAKIEQARTRAAEATSSNTAAQVSQQTKVVEVGTPGPQGRPGAALSTYEHVQATPQAIWTINHNLGFQPSVELRTLGGVEFDAAVHHTSANQTVVTLAAPIAGTARLN